MRTTTLLILGITTMLAAPAAAQGGGWVTIGTKRVGSGYDRDTINVMGNDRFRQIKLCTDRPIRMMDLNVVFANGGRQDVNVRSHFKAGSCTRAIDLKGERRNIAQIEMTYGKVRAGGRPEVRVMAR